MAWLSLNVTPNSRFTPVPRKIDQGSQQQRPDAAALPRVGHDDGKLGLFVARLHAVARYADLLLALTR
nr:hypothetical protein [Paraburkholderia sp. J67]